MESFTAALLMEKYSDHNEQILIEEEKFKVNGIKSICTALWNKGRLKWSVIKLLMGVAKRQCQWLELDQQWSHLFKQHPRMLHLSSIIETAAREQQRIYSFDIWHIIDNIYMTCSTLFKLFWIAMLMSSSGGLRRWKQFSYCHRRSVIILISVMRGGRYWFTSEAYARATYTWKELNVGSR